MSRTLIGFINKELIQSLRDPRMKITLFIMPLIQLCLFGFAISSEIKNIRIAANFATHDYVLRDIYEHSIASQWFIPAKSTNNDPYDLLVSDKADVVLVPPPGGFTKAVARETAQLQVLINSSNVIKAQSIDSYLQNIVKNTVEKDLKLEFAQNPIQISQRVLFNPDLDTAKFLVPGSMCAIMLMTTSILTALAIVREKELGTFEMLISAPVTRREIIFGKTVPYILIGLINFPFILAITYFVFDVPIRGSIIVLMITTFIFVCLSVALGTLISTFVKSQQQTALGTFLVLFPLVMLSGLMFPIENMPNYVKWLALIDPLYYYMGLIRNIMLKGGGMDFILHHTAILIFMTVTIVILSIHRFHASLD